MPERGPVQLLLLFFRSRVKPGWRLGLAVAFIAILGLLPGEESVYHRAQMGLAQSLRQATWKQALAGAPEQKSWPWDRASPWDGISQALSPIVPRLGLSAAALDDGSGAQRSGQQPISGSLRRSEVIDRHDPHLALGDVAIGDRITLTTANGLTHAYQVTGREILNAQDSAIDASPVGASDPHLPCSHPESALAGILRLIVEAVHADGLESQATSHEQRL
jgi:hypothetical protein